MLATLWCVGGTAPAAAARQPDAEPHAPTLEEAHDLLLRGAYAEAKAAYASLATDERHAQQAALGLARSRLATGEYDQAISDLEKTSAARTPAGLLLRAALSGWVGRYEASLHLADEAIALDHDSATARRLRAETLETLGRTDEALAAYRWFDERLAAGGETRRDAAWMTDLAVGFVRYSQLARVDLVRRLEFALTELLQEVYERVDRSYLPARIAAADLLRERFNNDERDGSVSDYTAALRINPHLSEAHVGLGEIALTAWDFEEVEQRVALALEVNPRFAPALHLSAGNLILQRRYEEAQATCDQALETNPRDLTALSLAASACACRYDDACVERYAARVRAVNPRCAMLHRALGDALSGIRQYEDAEREYLSAIAFDLTDANARTELGMMYMQWGRETRAREALDAAWALDSFNERTKFTLELLAQLEGMDRFESNHAIVRFDADRDPGLGRLAGGYLDEIYDTVTGDFDAKPSEKTIIEIFPTMRAFAVRITGKPWIHTVGASTGRVIALASPGDPAQSRPYNLADVIKHEFTHTVTLAATRNRIPHWFTEGLAVLEEDSDRGFAWMEMLVEALREDRLFTLESIDWGFIRPRRPGDRQLAYAQSEWMCEFIVERFGYETINALLSELGKKRTLAEAFRDRMALSPEDFDREFRAWALSQARSWGFDPAPMEDIDTLRARVRSEAGNAAALGRLSRAELARGNAERAVSAAKQALHLDDSQRDALETLGTVYASLGREASDPAERRSLDAAAQEWLDELAKVDAESWTAPKLLTEIALRDGRLDDAAHWAKRLQAACPSDPASWRTLAGIYLRRGETERANSQLVELARLERSDPAFPRQLATIHRGSGRLREAAYWYRQANLIDPFDAATHRILGELAEAAGDYVTAQREFTLLTQLEPERAEHFLRAARAARKAGDAEATRRLAKEAVRLDPDSPARSLIP